MPTWVHDDSLSVRVPSCIYYQIVKLSMSILYSNRSCIYYRIVKTFLLVCYYFINCKNDHFIMQFSQRRQQQQHLQFALSKEIKNLNAFLCSQNNRIHRLSLLFLKTFILKSNQMYRNSSPNTNFTKTRYSLKRGFSKKI